MYKTKTNIILERFLLKNAIKLEEERQEREPFFSKHHAKLASDYSNILSDLEEFVGYVPSQDGNDSNDFFEFVSKAVFDDDKPEEAFRKKYGNAAYLRALGDSASYYFKNKINDIIESKILTKKPTNPALESLYYDGIYAYEEPFECKSISVLDYITTRQLEFNINKKVGKYEITLIKPVDQLEFEQAYLIDAFKKLADKATDNETKKTYKRYSHYVTYMYEYYISISSGKQLIVPRLSNNDYKAIEGDKYSEEKALLNIANKNKQLLEYFKGVQNDTFESFYKTRSLKI